MDRLERDNDDNMPIIGIPAEIITHITPQIEMGERERGGEREREIYHSLVSAVAISLACMAATTNIFPFPTTPLTCLFLFVITNACRRCPSSAVG
jgi:hypothetical protein